MSPLTTARWTLAIGTAFVFLYFGIEKFLHPDLWIGWMPQWMDGLMGLSNKVWMDVTGVTEIVIGVMVLVPKRLVQKIGALLASLHLVAILTQIGWNEIAVRDMGLLCMTMALWYLNDKKTGA
jgi:uncharacterized membrane protein YphA (DoxX/SURF4 family)